MPVIQLAQDELAALVFLLNDRYARAVAAGELSDGRPALTDAIDILERAYQHGFDPLFAPPAGDVAIGDENTIAGEVDTITRLDGRDPESLLPGDEYRVTLHVKPADN